MNQKDFKDSEVKCIKCHKPFIITASEKRNNQQRGTVLPKRCPHCREGNRNNMHTGTKLDT